MHIRLKELREELGASQSALADKLGISQSALGYYERGERLADANTLSKMAEVFSVSTDYLLGRSDAKKPENEDIAKRLGLSEKAIETLEKTFRIDNKNSFTLALNTLVEDFSLLFSISEYLYYEIEEAASDISLYESKYKYRHLGSNSVGYLDSKKDINYMVPTQHLQVLDNRKYKQLVMLQIQEILNKMLEKENGTNRF